VVRVVIEQRLYGHFVPTSNQAKIQSRTMERLFHGKDVPVSAARESPAIYSLAFVAPEDHNVVLS
jgi:hypothetical protein